MVCVAYFSRLSAAASSLVRWQFLCVSLLPFAARCSFWPGEGGHRERSGMSRHTLLPDDSWQLSHGTLPVVFSLFPFFSCYGLAPGMQLTTPAL